MQAAGKEGLRERGGELKGELEDSVELRICCWLAARPLWPSRSKAPGGFPLGRTYQGTSTLCQGEVSASGAVGPSTYLLPVVSLPGPAARCPHG